MRDYALTQAHGTGSFGFSLSALFANWQARREVAKLESWDNRALHQLGITREDLHQALSLPLIQNSRLALEQYAFMRSRIYTMNHPTQKRTQYLTPENGKPNAAAALASQNLGHCGKDEN